MSVRRLIHSIAGLAALIHSAARSADAQGACDMPQHSRSRRSATLARSLFRRLRRSMLGSRRRPAASAVFRRGPLRKPVFLPALALLALSLWFIGATPTPHVPDSGYTVYGIRLPAFIGGYQVAFVNYPSDNKCVRRPIIDLTKPLVGTPAPPSGDDTAKVQEELKGLGIRLDSVDLAFTYQQPDIIRQNAQHYNRIVNESSGVCGGARGPAPMSTSSGGGQATTPASCPSGTPPFPSYVADLDTDVASHSDVNAQDVVLAAPQNVGSEQDAFSGIMNTIITEQYTWMQGGLGFLASGPVVFWADTSTCGDPQIYSEIPYVGGDPYYFTESYTNNSWWTCAENVSVPSTYTCINRSPYVIGTHLWPGGGTNNSVWLENHNSGLLWKTGFSNPWAGVDAHYYRNGMQYVWTTDAHKVGGHCQGWSVDNNGAITGDLEGGDTASWHINKVPLAQNC